MDKLPSIPKEIKRIPREVRFCTYQGGWHIIGPADLMQPGQVVEAHTRKNGTVTVKVGEYVAHRVVKHKEDSYSREAYGESSRFVIATVFNVDLE